MKGSSPIVPRNGRTLVVGVVARISGCQNQKELSLDDQVDHAKQAVADLYDGPVEFIIIKTTAKGERLDRPELEEVKQLLMTRTVDLLVMEDAGRLVRGTAAKEIWGVAVDHGTTNVRRSDLAVAGPRVHSPIPSLETTPADRRGRSFLRLAQGPHSE